MRQRRRGTGAGPARNECEMDRKSVKEVRTNTRSADREGKSKGEEKVDIRDSRDVQSLIAMSRRSKRAGNKPSSTGQAGLKADLAQKPYQPL